MSLTIHIPHWLLWTGGIFLGFCVLVTLIAGVLFFVALNELGKSSWPV